jgi:hypothetical protein
MYKTYLYLDFDTKPERLDIVLYKKILSKLIAIFHNINFNTIKIRYTDEL